MNIELTKPVMRPQKIKLPAEDKIYYAIIYTMIILLTMVVLYPLIYILSASFSSPAAVSSGKVLLWPVDISVVGYERVFSNSKVWSGYINTIFYTVVGTLINIFMTMICAFPLARKKLPYRNVFTFIFTFTMFFGGGMIPNYLLIRDLGMLNTRWALVVPGAMGVYQMIITRTFIQANIPDELVEMTQIDGCNDYRFFMQFVLPLSKAVLAVIAMQYAVGHWNAYFNAFLYLTEQKMYPLQSVLREILINSKIDQADLVDPELATAIQGMSDLLKYSLIVVATAPILCVYPFIQKYFVKGMMIGSLKG